MAVPELPSFVVSPEGVYVEPQVRTHVPLEGSNFVFSQIHWMVVDNLGKVVVSWSVAQSDYLQ